MTKTAHALKQSLHENTRTAQTALPVTVLQQLKGGEYEMARLDRQSANLIFDIMTNWNKSLKPLKTIHKSKTTKAKK